ncbi:hypothetical protein L7H23_08665 [Sphingopyxis sp. BSN-002]|uniref:hypothetical protein n=1 Tax=Sphingopyxis sp. BSN-002 TaxID=2911495 RepID=UPI001EDC20C2|nr:hypothetical protein [Sphingopyxis sp. BSN-002]UKK86152.1 hypothetical protein L7H23_08665 [Sphingopyxis sp. BSN-002]
MADDTEILRGILERLVQEQHILDSLGEANLARDLSLPIERLRARIGTDCGVDREDRISH